MRRNGLPISVATLSLILIPHAPGGGPKPKQDAKAEAVKKDLKRLEGTWEIVFTVHDGTFRPEQREETLTFRGDTFTVAQKGKVVAKGTIKIDPTSLPKFIDICHEEGFLKGSTLPGIYQVKENGEIDLCGSTNPDGPRLGSSPRTGAVAGNCFCSAARRTRSNPQTPYPDLPRSQT